MWSIAFCRPFPLIIFTAGVVGWTGGKIWTLKFEINAVGPEAVTQSVLGDATESLPHALRLVARPADPVC